MNQVDGRFRCMGCGARVQLESAQLEAAALEEAAAAVRGALTDADRRSAGG